MTRGVGSSPGSATSSEVAEAQLLLGRESLTDFSVAVRCPHGGPAVLANPPVDRRGNPFPTRNWLACRHLVAAVSRLESAGGVGMLEADPDMADPLTAAQKAHSDSHGGHWITGTADPSRVKCLHAHLAVALADGGSPVGDWILSRIDGDWPDSCCVARLREAAGG